MKIKNFNVLVVSGGGLQGLTLIKSLRLSGLVRIIMVDSSSENVSKYFVDSFYVVPQISKKEQFLSSLLEICEKENIRLIFPSTNIELLPLAESLEVFKERNISVAVSNLDFLIIISNKFSLYKFLIKEGFSTLPPLDISDESLKFPILGKPVDGWGGRGILILNSPDELSRYDLPELKSKYVWQPFLDDFKEYSIDCAINFDGTLSDIVVRRRVKTMIGFSVITENVHNAAIEDMIKKFLACISTRGACGIFNMQVLEKDSHYFLSDINPRVGTSAVFSCKLGINLPLFLCAYIEPDVYKDIPSYPSQSKDVKMVRYLEEFWVERANHKEIKAVVFDLDDTLINQKLWIVEKIRILWSQFNTVLPEEREFLLKAIQTIEEGNRSKLFDALSEVFNFKGKLREELIKAYREIEPRCCSFFPEVPSTLNELKKKELKLALLTDNPPESQKQKVKACDFKKIFDVVVYVRELNGEKPSKAAFKQVAKLLGIDSQSLIMVGDNLYKDIVGSLEANYQGAYWIVRNGTFFNFEEKLFNELFINKYNFKKIHNLRQLLWYL